MDPLTQGVVGAVLPQATMAKRRPKHSLQVAIIGFCGMLGGMAADLDVFIYSNTDPLLFLEYHRQFTHSLFFIPFGGFIVALLVHALLARYWHFRFLQTALYATLGYATHALLDTATSYGTMLFWPLSETRYSLSIISIIDPLFTIPLMVSVGLAAIYNKPYLARMGLIWVLIYLGLGWGQHQAARSMTEELAQKRGHSPERIEVKPSFGNILVWKSIYQANGQFFIDAMRVNIAPQIYEGSSIPILNIKKQLPWLNEGSQQAIDVARFQKFSDGFTALDPQNTNRIIDVRYSFVPNEIKPLFSILLSPKPGMKDHVKYQTHRDKARQKFGQLWQMLSKRKGEN